MRESYRNLIQVGLLRTRVLQERYFLGKELRQMSDFLITSKQEKYKKDTNSISKSSGVKIMIVLVFFIVLVCISIH